MKKLRNTLLIILFIFLSYILSINLLINLDSSSVLSAYSYKIIRQLHKKNIVNPFDFNRLNYNYPSSQSIFLFDFSDRDKIVNDSIITLALKEKTFKDELKTWRKANIYFESSNFKAKYKFHGTHLAPYINGKKSLRIKSKKYIKGRKEFKLISGMEANFINIFISSISRNQNLIAPDPGEIILATIDQGVEDYWLTSDLSKPYLSTEYNINSFIIFDSQDDWDRFSRIHVSELDDFFQYQDNENQITDSLSLKANRKYRNLKDFARGTISSSQIMEFFDEEYIGRFLANLYLFNDPHHIVGDNDKWLYNFENNLFYPIARNEGKFKPIRRGITNFDKGLFTQWASANTYKLYKKLLSNPTIKLARDRELFKLTLKKSQLVHKLDSLEKKYFFSHRSHPGESLSIIKAVINNNLKVISEYLRNCQVAIAYNVETKNLELVTDSRVPLLLEIKKNDYKYTVKPVKYKMNSEDLVSEIEEQYFFVGNDSINKTDLIFINEVTKDTIPYDRIIFNYY